ncbi:TolC family protein, partial [bacterium]|nr:TolC family protein [bacterium]
MVGYEIEMRRKEVDLAKREFKPDFVSSAEIMDSNNWSLRFGIMYPLYKDKKQKNALIEAEKGLLSIQKGYENERLELLYMLKEAYLMAKAATQNIKLYKTAILPQANLSYTSALANYKTGKIDFLMLFDNLMRLQESELRYYELLVEHEKQASEIERLVGGEL